MDLAGRAAGRAVAKARRLPAALAEKSAAKIAVAVIGLVVVLHVATTLVLKFGRGDVDDEDGDAFGRREYAHDHRRRAARKICLVFLSAGLGAVLTAPSRNFRR